MGALALGALLSFTASTRAQTAHAVWVDPAAGGSYLSEHDLPSALNPVGLTNPATTVATTLGAAFGPAVVPLAGGAASNQLTGELWVSDGTTISVEPNPNYAGAALPAVITGPAPVLTPGAPITGMAIDSADTLSLNGGAPVLWVCDAAGILAGFPAVLPLGAPVAAPAVILAGAGLTVAPTGLGFEPSTRSFYACDAVGIVYNFDSAGVAATPGGIAGLIPPTGAAFTGMSVNTTNGAGPGTLPPPAGSLQVAGAFHVMAIDSRGNVSDALPVPGSPIPLLAPPVPGGFTAAGTAVGLAYSTDMQNSTGFAGGPAAPTLTLTRPMTTGAVSPAVEMSPAGPFPGLLGFMLVDAIPSVPGIPFPPFLGLLGVALPPVGLTPIPVTTGTGVPGTGVAIPNTTLLPGAQASFQLLFGPQPVYPSGILSEVYTWTAGLL